ncbi:MAG: GatB/YqeY domain-containing protein [Roseiflexaceae bacterium]|nr:GatB/YqeY domain-containing protein [Roseiflexaceae bacterium]
MAIQEQLKTDLKMAMKAGERDRVEVIRMALAAIQNARLAQDKQAYDTAAGASADNDVVIERSGELDDEAVLNTLAKELKRRREAAELYRQAKRDDLAESEEAEAVILEEYLPRLLSAEELRPLISAKIAELGASGPGDISKLMPVLIKELKGKADGRVINQVARELLS